MLSRDPANDNPQSPTPSVDGEMIAVATATSTAPSVIVPPTPPNTEHGRSRANSLLSSSSAPSSSSPKCAHVCTKSCLSSGSRSGRTKFVNFAEKLEEVQEKTPGAFYENDTDVPNNTPYSTEAGTEYTPDSPRSGSAPSLSGDLAIIDEVLEGLPSKKSSPAPSTFSGSTSTSSEPLYLLYPPRNTPVKAASQLCIIDNIGDHLTFENLTSPARASFSSESSAGTTAVLGEGIREFTDWATDIEAEVKRNLKRLENLANDDFQRDSSLSQEEYYRLRLLNIFSGEELPQLFEAIETADEDEIAQDDETVDNAEMSDPPKYKFLNDVAKPIDTKAPGFKVPPLLPYPHEVVARCYYKLAIGAEKRTADRVTGFEQSAQKAKAEREMETKKCEDRMAAHEDMVLIQKKELDDMRADITMLKHMLLESKKIPSPEQTDKKFRDFVDKQAKGSECTTKKGDDATGENKKA